MARVLGLAIVTLLAVALGGFQGRQSFQLVSSRADAEPTPRPDPAAANPPKSNVRELKPIITNLASPPGMWVRLEAAVVADQGIADLDKLVGEITTDTVAYLRTLSVSDLAGAEGLRHLRQDLTERAEIRSGKRVREIIIETLVVQ